MKKQIFAIRQTDRLAMLQTPITFLYEKCIVHKSFFNLIYASIVAFALLFAPEKVCAQCPTTTYTVGSGVGIPNLSGAPAGLANMTGGTVKIWGSFTVDAGSWQMRGVTVYLSSFDAAIKVNNNCILDAKPNPIGNVRTQFEACPGIPSWFGIEALASGTVNLLDCNILDACTAVVLQPGSTAQITGNTFSNTRTCIAIAGSVTLLGDGIAHNVFEEPNAANCGGGIECYPIK